MLDDIQAAAERAAEKLYVERVEEATREFFECLEKEHDELLGDEGCETTYQESLMGHFASLQRAKKAAESASIAVKAH